MSLPGTSRRCMRAAGAAVNCIARIAGITSIIRIEINVRANLGKRRARHRSPGALTCAKLGRFVHWMAPLHRACADWPRTSARGFFRANPLAKSAFKFSGRLQSLVETTDKVVLIEWLV